MKYKVGDKLVCIVNNDTTFAPCEIVEIEDRVKGIGRTPLYKLRGYRTYYSEDTLDKLFRKY